jgi:hypothetical protein
MAAPAADQRNASCPVTNAAREFLPTTTVAIHEGFAPEQDVLDGDGVRD